MKMRANITFHVSRFTRHTAYSLIEMLAYMALFFIVAGIAYKALYATMDSSAALRRNATDISHALEAGERWRADVRSVTRPIRVETIAGEKILHLPQARAEISYRFSANAVSRRVGSGPWSSFLADVKNSNFISDRRTNVTAWRWELELKPYQKKITRTRPLFTFIAVPTGNSAR
jgi:hypothetical protein